ncbi:hypothetical protein DUI87_26751 [Hirundo rustica rustica]|uniref:Uncharacterized protein n=1 Tax=Hirundo rustica rustica TaxID=333673 RepID=A0A3M0JPD7_HIRRU|nr:hypothetical protein DUI87_26751 [Hirundo rustica rustica]
MEPSMRGEERRGEERRGEERRGEERRGEERRGEERRGERRGGEERRGEERRGEERRGEERRGEERRGEERRGEEREERRGEERRGEERRGEERRGEGSSGCNPNMPIDSTYLLLTEHYMLNTADHCGGFIGGTQPFVHALPRTVTSGFMTSQSFTLTHYSILSQAFADCITLAEAQEGFKPHERPQSCAPCLNDNLNFTRGQEERKEDGSDEPLTTGRGEERTFGIFRMKAELNFTCPGGSIWSEGQKLYQALKNRKNKSNPGDVNKKT